MINEKFKLEWIQRWAGSFTFISCSFWGRQYFHDLKAILGVNFDHTLFIHRKGIVTFYVLKKELNQIGTFLASKTVADKSLAKINLEELQKNTDILDKIMKKMSNKILTAHEYQEFLHYFKRHLAYHSYMKKTVDYLQPEILNELLSSFREVRIYSEHIYSDTETFFRQLMVKIAEKENRNADFLTCLTQPELETYILKQVLPKEDVLQDRYNASVINFEKDEEQIIVGEAEATAIEAQVQQQETNTGLISGTSACKGKVQGTARIILDPFKNTEFNMGDILVTGMTRPEFMPFINKAAAIVTDVGGVLCHAAILAREHGIPCIIGTGIATKVIQDGAKIEVDADQGCVRIIS